MAETEFLNGFEKENDEWWKQSCTKQIFRDSVVRYFIFTEGDAAVEEDATPASGVRVRTNSLGPKVSKAWKRFAEDVDAFERSLQDVLTRRAKENYARALRSAEKDAAAHGIMNSRDFGAQDSLEVQVSLDGIFLHDGSPDDEAYMSFEFSVGWDDEHGLEVITHRGVPLAVSENRGEFPNVLETTRYIKLCVRNNGKP